MDRRYFPPHGCGAGTYVQIVVSGPDSHWNPVQELYFAAITTAQQRVYMTTPYFIPDAGIYTALKTAAVSGIDVKIIIPDVTDSRIVKWASHSYLEDLLEAGVRFYQYRKGFMHSKVVIVDDVLASVGTANLDMRSFYDNFELNAVLFGREAVERLERDFVQDLRDSREIVLAEFERRSRFARGREALARLLSPLF